MANICQTIKVEDQLVFTERDNWWLCFRGRGVIPCRSTIWSLRSRLKVKVGSQELLVYQDEEQKGFILTIFFVVKHLLVNFNAPASVA